MKNLSVGFLGLSHLHPKSYVPVLRAAKGFELVAASDTNRAVLSSFASEFSVRTYEHWQTLLEREQLDLAVLFLPHRQCPEAAIACAERGVNILAEKPMAADSEGLARMIDAAAKAGVLLSSPYVWRYHPVARAMKQYVEGGMLGRIVGCEGRCAAGRLQRYIDAHAEWMLARSMSGGGPMYNLGVHWIDLFRWLLQDDVAEVLGKNVTVNEHYDIEDNSFAILTFSRGAVLALDISYTVPDSFPFGRDLYLGMRGTAGVLSWSPSFEGLKESLFVCSDAPEFAPANRRRIDFELEPQPGYAGAHMVQFLSELGDAIRNRRPPAISGEDGLRALEVVEAIYESAESGRAVRPQRHKDRA
jgi:predicted dehydrogenase